MCFNEATLGCTQTCSKLFPGVAGAVEGALIGGVMGAFQGK